MSKFEFPSIWLLTLGLLYWLCTSQNSKLAVESFFLWVITYGIMYISVVCVEFSPSRTDTIFFEVMFFPSIIRQIVSGTDYGHPVRKSRPKINSHSQIFRYAWSIFCLPHRPKFSDIFDLCLHWVSVVRDHNEGFVSCKGRICWMDGSWQTFAKH